MAIILPVAYIPRRQKYNTFRGENLEQQKKTRTWPWPWSRMTFPFVFPISRSTNPWQHWTAYSYKDFEPGQHSTAYSYIFEQWQWSSSFIFLSIRHHFIYLYKPHDSCFSICYLVYNQPVQTQKASLSWFFCYNMIIDRSASLEAWFSPWHFASRPDVAAYLSTAHICRHGIIVANLQAGIIIYVQPIEIDVLWHTHRTSISMVQPNFCLCHR